MRFLKYSVLFLLFFMVTGCNSIGVLPSTTTSPAETEREYNEILKTYKPPTEEALNDLLGGSGDPTKTTVIFRNSSSCNMVLTISSFGYEEKIPIAAGQLRYSVLKKGTYQLSGMVCRSIYRSTKTFTQSVTLTFRD